MEFGSCSRTVLQFLENQFGNGMEVIQKDDWMLYSEKRLHANS